MSEHKESCGFALYGPPAICTCGAMTSTPPMKTDGDSSLSPRDAPSDEHSMPDVAAHADLALQDALITEMDSHGDPVAAYDSAVFLALMRGNGYQITRAGEPLGEADSPSSPPDAVLELVEALEKNQKAIEGARLDGTPSSYPNTVPAAGVRGNQRAVDQILADFHEIKRNALSRYRGRNPLADEADPRSRNADTQVKPGGEKIG